MVRSFFIHTFGCQMNVQDSEKMAALLADMGYKCADDPRRADLIIVNTCAIREKAEQKALSLLGRFQYLKKRNHRLIVGVSGCFAQKLGYSFLERMPHLDFVLGTQNIHKLPDVIAEVQENKSKVVKTELYDTLPAVRNVACPVDGKVTAFVTIMQGCNNFCTFCVVPYLRGREMSRPWRDIVDEVRFLVKHGVKEVTLLGQNVNSYGSDLGERETFVGLLKRICEVEGLERLRFTTSHPKDLSAELINCFGKLHPLCEHIHLPVQSGSNRILERMNRKYTREDYLDKVNRLRDVCPEIAISSDVIVGFPGETEKDFELTLDLMEKIKFDNLFSFKYSRREGTAAASLDDQVPEEAKSRRLSMLQKLQDSHTMERNKAWEGRVVEVLVEGTSKNDPKEVTGRTRQNKIVNFPGDAQLRGKLLNVRITEAFLHSLRGEII
ncbi:MAG: tRNA (N6-isopentenyl adenosine(37)-C2)-methylthiotransferase MiaB [Syntrophales bacterium]|nr:tRNA (N6-isopentenyl adenosine(37)-C2)-methylthiotransferase MiaB [Syntrophales bacterium]